MATTQRSEVPPRRRTQSCTYCEHGDYAAKRSAVATTQRSEVPPGCRTQSCRYCEHGETVDAQH